MSVKGMMGMEILLLVLLMNLRYCLPYFVTVDAHAEECFFDKVTNGTKLGKISIERGRRRTTRVLCQLIAFFYFDICQG
jgi:hypothetical protein